MKRQVALQSRNVDPYNHLIVLRAAALFNRSVDLKSL
jgi:hypothetical protein